jgi:hypothetical protein
MTPIEVTCPNCKQLVTVECNLIQSSEEVEKLIRLLHGGTSYHFSGDVECECGDAVMVMLTISGGKNG